MARSLNDSWEGPNEVGRGWGDLKQVFSTGDGIIYGITGDGKLLWFGHNAILSGAGLETTGAWEGPNEVGRGWDNLKQVFSTGEGVIYAVTQDGKLRWYKHNGYLKGRGLESSGAWQGPIELGTWGNTFKQLFSAGSGIIYDIEADGTLKWSRHLSYGAGYFKPGFIPPEALGDFSDKNWQGPRDVGTGWAGLTQVFALLPNTDSSGGVLPVDNRSRSTTGTRPGVHSTVNPQPPPRRIPNFVRRPAMP